MTQPVSRKWWLALSIAAAPASAPAFAAKDVVVAVGSNFTTLDPMMPTIPCRRQWRSPFIKARSALIKR